jgi:uncharacterized protein (TIGR02246 family)
MRTFLATALLAVLTLANLGLAAAAERATSSSRNAATAGAPQDQPIRQATQALLDALNRGEPKQVAALLLPDAELIDEAGNVYRGRDEIAAVFSRFFQKFPGATTKLNIEKIQAPSDSVAIEDGTRTVATKDGAQAITHYTMVYAKRDGQWNIASIRELPGEAEATAHEQLAPLAWMVGDWVDESSEQAVAISCRWSDTGNFLLVDFAARIKGKKALESNQRIGWDPLSESVRSWVFDSDGGYGEGRWTRLDGRWVIKSTAVMPDGTTGSATIILEPAGKDKFVMKGIDRILGDAAQPDFEAAIVRKPPQPSK